MNNDNLFCDIGIHLRLMHMRCKTVTSYVIKNKTKKDDL